ncbi:MAG: hypothetical protein HY270_09355 [Deltaproteobacteria bacterium]|nr:hypothetical protein [Deltaproteobacteria bacterium]
MPRYLCLLIAGCTSVLVLSNVASWGQDLSLNEDSEAGFRRLIQMAQNGRLGDDVSNASVSVVRDQVRLELKRAGLPSKWLTLTAKQASSTSSRYFDIRLDAGATANDVALVAAALDAVFAVDPFQTTAGLFESPQLEQSASSFVEAWVDGGWPAVWRTLGRRLTTLASLRYTIAVIAMMVGAVVASLLLLWGASPEGSGA